MKVLAAMSGGVDSAVAAARAAQAGHDVTAVHMALMRNPAPLRSGARGCCSLEDASDARRAADILGLDYYVWDLSKDFEELVVADFLTAYQAGRTPNPCVRCNQYIKFAALLERAEALGFDAVCTGHYAQLGRDADSRVTLSRARDLAKDQSYVLAAAGPAALARAIFPLGLITSKADVRSEAAVLGLPVASKPDSYDICFVADGNAAGYLRARIGSKPGPILDETGLEVGQHQGAYAFTIGQRRGLGLPYATSDGRARYVTAVDVAANTVRVGPVEDLVVDHFNATEVVAFEPIAAASDCLIQVRAHGRTLAAKVFPAADGGAWRIELTEPLRALASGQSVVIYAGERVLAHGLVER